MYTPEQIAKMLGAANTVPQLRVVLYQLQLSGLDVQADIDRILAERVVDCVELCKLWIYARSLQTHVKQKPNNYTDKP